MAGIVVYRVGFALIYLCKIKTISNLSKKYKVTRFNLGDDVKKMRLENDWSKSLGES